MCSGIPHMLHDEPQSEYTLLPLALKKPSQKSNDRNSSKFSGRRPAKSSFGML